MYAYADPAWATRRVNATKDSATSATAIMPIAYVSGAAGPAALTTRDMLKAAVMLGAMTASDRPTASGKLKRRARIPMFLLPCSTLSAAQVACPIQVDDAARHGRGRAPPAPVMCAVAMSRTAHGRFPSVPRRSHGLRRHWPECGQPL